MSPNETGETIFCIVSLIAAFIAAGYSVKQDKRKAIVELRAKRRKERIEWDKEMRRRIAVDKMMSEYKACQENKKPQKPIKPKKPVRKAVGFFSGPDVEKFLFGEEETRCQQIRKY